MLEMLLLSPAEAYAAQLLDEGKDKVALLSRIAAADLKVLLQQPKPDELLERVCEHFKQLQDKQQQQPGQQQQQANGSSGVQQQQGPLGQATIRPCDLLPEAAAEFEKALQAASGVMPVAWRDFDSWRELEQLYVMSDKHTTHRLLHDRRAHFRQRRLVAQRATQQEAVAVQRRQENWAGEVAQQQQEQQLQQQPVQVAKAWTSPQHQFAADFWPAEGEEQQQQQLHQPPPQLRAYAEVVGGAAPSSSNGPVPAPAAVDAQQQGSADEQMGQEQQQQMLMVQDGMWDPSVQEDWQQQQQQQRQPDMYPGNPSQQEQQQASMHHMQQQQQPFMAPHMQQQQQPFMPPHMQQQEHEQRRKYEPNELTPAAAQAFASLLHPDMLPPDWRQMNSWFSLDARVKFTVEGTDPAGVQHMTQYYHYLKQKVIAQTAAELQGLGLHPAQQLLPPPGIGMPAAGVPLAQPNALYVTGFAGTRPPQQQQQQPGWVGQEGHPAALQEYMQQQQQQQHMQQHLQQHVQGGAGEEQDDDDLDEMLGLLNVNK
jgi:hypothetical protein